MRQQRYFKDFKSQATMTNVNCNLSSCFEENTSFMIMAIKVRKITACKRINSPVEIDQT